MYPDDNFGINKITKQTTRRIDEIFDTGKLKHERKTGIQIAFSRHEQCLYSEFFWSVYSVSRTEYRDYISIASQMRENTDPKNSECEDFLRSVKSKYI